jgi:amino acid permease
LNHVVNAAILISAWSSGNAWCYAGSRTLFSLAGEGQAPKIFLRCNRNGVPWVAVVATWTIGLLSFLNLSSSGQTVFYWFTNLTTVGGFLNWVLIGIAYLVCFLTMQISIHETDLNVALPQGHHLPQHAGHAAVQDALATLRLLLRDLHR